MKNNYLVFRLALGSDLYLGILEQCVLNKVSSGCIISAVGCVKELTIRIADGVTIHHEITDFEVTSLSGTISEDGLHCHLQVCDKNLRSIGGHLQPGTIVNTTMEIVILDLKNEYQLSREKDETTGYDELVVIKK